MLSKLSGRITPVVGALFLAVIGGQSTFSFFGGSPSIDAPCPILLIIPAFLLDGIRKEIQIAIVCIVPAILFYTWSRRLTTRDNSKRRIEEIVWALIVVLSIAWFASGWYEGVKYEGRVYTVATAFANLALAAITGGLMLTARARPSPTNAFVTRFILVAWLASYAFPWLGETP